MSEIVDLSFSEDSVNRMKAHHYGRDWPVVYLLLNEKTVYIGETTNFVSRMRQHLSSIEKKYFKKIFMCSDAEFNKSAILDIESHLIEYIAGEGYYRIVNKSVGMRHNYYDREKYLAKLELVWENLREKKIVSKTLEDIKNSDLFKYSPYKSLTIEQFEVAEEVIRFLQKYTASVQIISGSPGTGKTILALYLLRTLVEKGIYDKHEVALVVPMVSLRKTLKRVLKYTANMSPGMVIGPNEVVKKDYEIIVVDEAHRLQRRKGITNYRAFDEINNTLNIGKDGTQLDWVLASAPQVILFYDETQSIKPADVRPLDYVSIQNAKRYELTSQMRVAGGVGYLNYIQDLFSGDFEQSYKINEYEIKLFDDLGLLVDQIKANNNRYDLCRLVAGYAWPWTSKIDKNAFDIEIENVKLRWNSTANDWVNSENSINEVGCIHTIQGYDLNYTGVIIGPELSYDEKAGCVVVKSDNYYDKKGKYGIEEPEELKKYVINIYKVLLTRGIKGTYIYVVDPGLREYIRESLQLLSKT